MIVEGWLSIVENWFGTRAHSMSILYGTFPYFFTNPAWIATQIEHGENLGLVAVFSIVNPEWETARKHAMKFEMQRMDSAKQSKAFDVG